MDTLNNVHLFWRNEEVTAILTIKATMDVFFLNGWISFEDELETIALHSTRLNFSDWPSIMGVGSLVMTEALSQN